MQVKVEVKCVKSNFVGRGLSDLETLLLVKLTKFPFWIMDYIVHGGQKI